MALLAGPLGRATAAGGGVAAGRIAEHADGSAEMSGFLASEDGILLTEAELTTEELPPTRPPSEQA